jgi:NAD(P)-dependent dehydrogenase (short-subunit alcohol dehydrogenase family)
MTVLREDLLAGRRVAVGTGVGASVSGLLTGLGAAVEELGGLDAAAVDGGDGASTALHAVILDAGGAFGAGGQAGLADALQETWDALAAATTRALIPGGGGKVILIAPRAGAGPHADAARAGLENLARTLSVEWARYGITVTAIAPGRHTSEGDVGSLVAFLTSVAGDYYSGCRFDLGAVT